MPNTWTALQLASYFGCLERVKYRVKKGDDINFENDEGDTPLLLAAKGCHTDVIEFLISIGANINCCDDFKWTLLHHASSKGWLSIVSTVLKKGMDVNSRIKDGQLPLTFSSSLEMISAPNAGIEPDNVDNKTEPMPSSSAECSQSQSHVTKGCGMGKTSLLLAIINGHEEVAKLLISAGADVTCCDTDKFTALHYSVIEGWVEISKSLVERKADVNARADNGLTPLHIACIESKKELVEYLVNVGSDCNANYLGESTLTTLIKNFNDFKLVKLFIEKGAYINYTDYKIILKKPLLRIDFVQDITLCSQFIIDKFNNKDLPKLYKLAKSANLPQIDKMKISVVSKVNQDVMQSVQHEVQTNGHCNVLKARPIVLRMLSVKSFIDYCHDMKQSQVALKPIKKSGLQNGLKRPAAYGALTRPFYPKKKCARTKVVDPL